MKTTIMIVMALALTVVGGCGTWHGLGKDIGKTGDAMAGEGKYTMTVHATPDKVTAAARRAVEQLKMTDIDSSGDRSEGKVTAKTSQQEKVTIDIEQSGDNDSKVTIHTRGGDADKVSKQIQDQINSNLR
jgi:predicted small secreted protein